MDSKTENIHEGHRKSVRERYIRRGSLDDYEDHQILEMLLFYAIKRRDTNPLAHRLINRFGSLKNVLNADFCDLLDAGLSENTATLLKLTGDIGASIDRRDAYSAVIHSVDDAMYACHGLLFRQPAEAIAILCLDTKNRVVKISIRSDGFASKVDAIPKWVVDTALSNNASSIILSHNHPSGTSQPSQQDWQTTIQLQTILQPLGVALLEHVIVTKNECFAMTRHYKKDDMLSSKDTNESVDMEADVG